MAEQSGGQVGDDPALAAKALQTLPVEKDLRRIADKNCGKKWKCLLTYLGLKNAKIEELEIDGNTSSDACFQGLVYWLGGNADDPNPVNWSTLLTAMEEAGMAGDAREWRQKIVERCAASLDRPRDAEQSGNDKTPTPGQEEPRSNVPTSATTKDDKKKEPGPSGSKRSQPPQTTSGDKQLQPKRCKSASEAFPSGPEQAKTLCDNPHIQSLKRHVMNRYKILKPSESRVMVEYVQLALLEAQPYTHHEDEEEMMKLKKGGGKKLDFLESFRSCGLKSGKVREFVDVADLLKPTSDAANRMKVVYGQAGIGKTTMLTHICRSLTSDKPMKSSYALVLYFPLRDKAVSSAKRLSGLLSYYATADLDLDLSALRRAIVNSGSKEVLFIFDGADEVQDLLSSEERGVFQDLLEGRTLPQVDVIVSSRPGGLPQLVKQDMTTFYEIHGLDLSSIEEYINEFFKSNPKKGERLWKELKSREDLMGGAHIPMNLLIFCHILDRGGLPPTLTECYKQYIVQVYNRKSPGRKWVDFDDCPEEVKKLLLSLGRLAYTGMMSTPSTFVFEEKQVKEAFKTSSLDTSSFKGLLHEHHRPFGYISRSTFNFSHATQQELFCAYYISHLPVEKQIEFLRNSMSQPKFSVVLRFYAGLTKLSDEQVVDTVITILHEPGYFPRSFLRNGTTDSNICMLNENLHCNNDRPGLLHLFHFLYESQNSKLTQSVARHFSGQAVKFNLFLTSFDTRVIAHCIRESRELMELTFLNSTESDSEHLLSCTSSILMSASVGQIHELTLWLVHSHLTQANASRLKEGLTRTAVEELELWVNDADLSAVAAIFVAPRLKRLDLTVQNYRCVSDSDLEVAQSSARNITIKKLEVNSQSSLLLPVVKGLAANTCVEALILKNFDRIAGDGGVGQALAKACTTNTTLKDIKLENVSPFPLMEVLCSRKVPLESLALRDYVLSVTDSDFEMAQLVSKNARIKELLFRSPPSFLLPVVKGLAANTCVEKLVLISDGSGIDGDVAQALATACTTNTTLKVIELADISPFPLMEVLCSREVPLERLRIILLKDPPINQCTLETLETLAKNMKVKMFEEWCILQHQTTEYWKALADGVSRNKFLRKVDLKGVHDADVRDYISAKLSTLETVKVQ